ncbi:MAG: DNA translocase FtsK [Treponema sp.]
MKTKLNIFKILTFVLSIVFFCIGVILFIALFLALTPEQSQSRFFFIGYTIFSTYHFSAFLIPLLFLYASVLLIIPVWSHELSLTLFGMPFYFITAVLAEQLIYMLLPIVSLPLLKHFIIISIILSALLFICFEIFLMIMLSEKIPIHITFKEISSEDIIADSYIEDTTPEPENTTIQGESRIVEESINNNFDISEPKTESAEISADSKENQITDSIVANIDEEIESTEARSPTTTNNNTNDSIDMQNTLSDNEKIDMDISDRSDESTEAIKDLEIIPESYTIKDITIEEALSTVKHDIIDINDRDVDSEQTIGEENCDLTTPAMHTSLERTENTETQAETAILDETTETLPIFDPSDPNNLFNNLAEITASIERIKQNDANTALAIETASIPENTSENNHSEPLLPNTDDSLQPTISHVIPKIDKDESEESTQKIADIPAELPSTEAPNSESNGNVASTIEKTTPLIDSLVVIEQLHQPVSSHSEKKGYNTAATVQLTDKQDTLTNKLPKIADAALSTANISKIAENTVTQLPPVMPKKKYLIPFDLLTNYPDGEYWIVDDATRRAAMMLKSTFSEFKIDVSITGIRKGPVVTMFEVLPSPGIKLSKITNLQDNIALRLAASSVRIVAPIPGKHAVGIEVPNKKRSIVSFRELIETDIPESQKMAIPVVLGKDVTGNPQLLDLAQTPHLLIAGATGSGKSVCVNSIILSILYNRRPDEVKLILVDPKIVELKLYNDISHLLAPVITEPKRAFQALQYCLCEMERRYALLDNIGVRDIKTFNKKIKVEKLATEALPYIVIIIDEFADLMACSGKELEATVARLCAMSRAVGIHLVLATQRPSIDVITGLIKANIPSRIAFMVASKTDSRIILDEMGAEKLLGKGDMLFVSATQPFPARMQGAFVSEQEVEKVVACVKEYSEPEYIDDEIFVDDDDDVYDTATFSDMNDPLYDQALEIVTFAGKASASYVQRKLKIGYNRAARLIEEMEARGIVGPANGSKPREILHHP